MKSSWSVCSVVGDSVACACPHSNMNVCRHRTRYCCCWFWSCTRIALPHLIRHILLLVPVVLVCLQRLSCMQSPLVSPVVCLPVVGDCLFCLCFSRILGTMICMVGVSIRARVCLVLSVAEGLSFLMLVVLVVSHPHCQCRTRTCSRLLPQSLLILSIPCRMVLFLITSSCHQSLYPLPCSVLVTIVILIPVNLLMSGPSSDCSGTYSVVRTCMWTRFHRCPSLIQYSVFLGFMVEGSSIAVVVGGDIFVLCRKSGSRLIICWCVSACAGNCCNTGWCAACRLSFGCCC